MALISKSDREWVGFDFLRHSPLNLHVLTSLFLNDFFVSLRDCFILWLALALAFFVASFLFIAHFFEIEGRFKSSHNFLWVNNFYLLFFSLGFRRNYQLDRGIFRADRYIARVFFLNHLCAVIIWGYLGCCSFCRMHPKSRFHFHFHCKRDDSAFVFASWKRRDGATINLHEFLANHEAHAVSIIIFVGSPA